MTTAIKASCSDGGSPLCRSAPNFVVPGIAREMNEARAAALTEPRADRGITAGKLNHWGSEREGRCS